MHAHDMQRLDGCQIYLQICQSISEFVQAELLSANRQPDPIIQHIYLLHVVVDHTNKDDCLHRV